MFCLSVGVASAAAPAYDLDGTWSATIHCKITASTGKLVISKWNPQTGDFHGRWTIGHRSLRGTATESGTTVKVTSSNVAAVIGRTGSVAKQGSKLVMTFHLTPSECPTGGSVVFTNPNPKGHGGHPKKKKHKHHKKKK